MNIVCDQPTPTEEGYYIWTSSAFPVLPAEMIHVVRYPAKSEFGIEWESYLGVAGMGGRYVAKLRGTFSKKITFTK